MTIKTYVEEFPPGTRIVVRADKSEGTDHDFNGRRGTVVAYGRALAVEFDKPPRHCANPVIICLHNLRHERRRT